jgi:hypothetical protein
MIVTPKLNNTLHALQAFQVHLCLFRHLKRDPIGRQFNVIGYKQSEQQIHRTASRASKKPRGNAKSARESARHDSVLLGFEFSRYREGFPRRFASKFWNLSGPSEAITISPAIYNAFPARLALDEGAEQLSYKQRRISDAEV